MDNDYDCYKTTNDKGELIGFYVHKYYSYEKLMKANPTHVARISIDLDFYEHPIHGDESPLIVIDKHNKKAFLSDYYDLPSPCELLI